MRISIFNMGRPVSLPAAPPTEDITKTGSQPPGRAPRRDAPLESPAAKPEALEWRERALNYLLGGASLLACLTLVLGAAGLIERQDWFTLGLYGLFCLGLLALYIARSANAALRATGLLLLVWLMGTYLLFNEGLTGSGRVFLLAVPFLAAFLLDNSRFGRLTRSLFVALSIGSIGFAGYAATSGTFQLPALLADRSGAAAWSFAIIAFATVALLGGSTLSYFTRRLEERLFESQAAAQRLEQERQRLESQAQRGAADLQRRLVQIRTASEVTRSISNLRDLQELLAETVELVKERFELYYVGLFLIEPAGGGLEYAVLAAGTGEAGQKMVGQGHRLLVGGDSMIGWATANCQARIALDVGQEAVRFNNPNLPLTRSELALPILTTRSRELHVLGAMSIQSEKEAAFDQDDILVLQGIADALGSAIQNARLFAQAQDSLEEIQSLHQQYLQRAWTTGGTTPGSQEYLYEALRVRAGSAAQSDLGTGTGAGTDVAPEPKILEIPIRLRGQEIGWVNLEMEAGRELSVEDQTFIEGIISQSALALENARLLQEAQRLAWREGQINWISSQMSSSVNLDTILQNTVRELGRSLGTARAFIQIGDSRVEDIS